MLNATLRNDTLIVDGIEPWRSRILVVSSQEKIRTEFIWRQIFFFTVQCPLNFSVPCFCTAFWKHHGGQCCPGFSGCHWNHWCVHVLCQSTNNSSIPLHCGDIFSGTLRQGVFTVLGCGSFVSKSTFMADN